MARGNQRDKAREKNLKDQSGQKKKNTQSGTEFAKTKEQQAAIMRQKQDEGMSRNWSIRLELVKVDMLISFLANAKKQTPAAEGSKK
ncbi:MAG: hypothetical protein M1812_005607 [Candelaria pacifica]|nr:MAG: hypothetical protein M1812_005607 [Candelaria pacifica]